MTTAAVSLFRSLLIYGICVPLALMLGYLITTPYDFTSFTVVGAVLFLLLVLLMLAVAGGIRRFVALRFAGEAT